MSRSWHLHLFLLFQLLSSGRGSAYAPIRDRIPGADGDDGSARRAVIDVDGGPGSVVWVVQLSDLHFSVHHPERALDFKRLLGPALAMIKPSLVLITGDLTDGKSRDLLVMKQNEEEWIEYQDVMADVIKQSGLDSKIFYDLRGNHDQFGVPTRGGAYDFYSKYSNNAHAGRSGNVCSVTIQSNGWKHLFVGFDSAMDIGLRGPTNLFGHPSEQLLTDLDVELSQWNSEPSQSPVTKLSFGHFPLSFSTTSGKGRSLKDIFLKHSLSAYVCGHLHSRFGKNLKRNHRSGYHFPIFGDFYQLNLHQGVMPSILGEKDCSEMSKSPNEFWEWEMGDWRKRRAMRLLAIDSGQVSFLDTDFSLGIQKTIILQTFPLDSRFMQRASSNFNYRCQFFGTSSYETIRALVFSEIDIYVVYVKIYDSRPGHLNLVMETAMKRGQNRSRGDLYETPWNWKAFVDPSPDRYWMQIEAVDIMGDSTFSQLRPFSINGLVAKVSWTWSEFLVMRIHWGSVFYPVLYTSLVFLFSLILIPRAFTVFVKDYTYRSCALHSYDRGIFNNLVFWFYQSLMELSKSTFIWSSALMYSIYLTFFPWFYGNIFTKTGEVGYLTLTGWSIKSSYHSGVKSQLGVPDIMVVVLPHICFVFFPAVLVMSALLAEQAAHRIYSISYSKKKQDDAIGQEKQLINCTHGSRIPFAPRSRWMRKFLLLICLAISWKHWKQCRALVKAYEMNPFIHAPVYCFMLPMLLVYTFCLTGAPWKSH